MNLLSDFWAILILLGALCGALFIDFLLEWWKHGKAQDRRTNHQKNNAQEKTTDR
jgi:hypothetical protein